MSRSIFILNIILVLSIVTFDISTTSHAAQTNLLLTGVTCFKAQTPGRPTLKKRAPAKDASASRGGGERDVEKEKPHEKIADKSALQQHTFVRFEGLKSISEADLCVRLTEAGINLTNFELFDSVKAERMIYRALADAGFDNAVVHVRGEETRDGLVKTFIIFEGEHFPIQSVRFEGNRVFPSETLANEFSKCSDTYQIKTLNMEQVDLCLTLVLNFVRSKGYLQAKVGELRKEISGHITSVTVPFEEGGRYRLGKIDIEGATLFSREGILKILDIKSGDTADGEKIGKGLFETLAFLYGEHGFVQYTSEPEPEFHDVSPATGEGIVDFKIFIEEGQRFKIGTITFEGHEDVSREYLRTALLVREGDYYNQRLFRESFKELCKLGFCLDPDKDTEFKVDDETALLELKILLRNKVD